MIELWRAAPELADSAIEDADDTARWPSAAGLRLQVRVARMTPRGMLALERLWDRWGTLAAPIRQPTEAERKASRRAARELYDAIAERGEDVFTGRAPAGPFVAWACEQVPGLAVMLGDVPPPPLASGPRWVPPPNAEAEAVAERIVRAERKV
jgi:hypothetical protein